jgi:hypothetical protein
MPNLYRISFQGHIIQGGMAGYQGQPVPGWGDSGYSENVKEHFKRYKY